MVGRRAYETKPKYEKSMSNGIASYRKVLVVENDERDWKV